MSSRLAAVLVVLFAPVIARAQPLADRVPANAIVYIGWRGSADLGPGYPESNLKAVLDDSNVPDFVDRFLPEVIDKLGQMNPDAGQVGQIVATIARPTWQHPTAFFFAGLTLDQHKEPVPHLGIIWEPGRDADSLAKQLHQLVDQAQTPFPVKVVQQDSIVALIVGYTDPESAIAGRITKPLAGDATFKATNAHLGVKDAVAAAYIDYERLFGMIDDLIKSSGEREPQTMWPKVRDDLGLQSLKRLAAASGFDGKDYGTEVFLQSPEPRSGILKLVGDKPLGDEILAAIPQTVTTAGAGRFDSAGLFDLIRRLAADLDPQAAREFDRFFDSISSDSGVDVRRDLLASVGDAWAFFADPTIGGRGLASLTIVNRLKDPAKFEDSMARIEDYALKQLQKEAGAAGANLPVTIKFDTVKIEDMTIHYLAVPLVAPCWVVRDGNLYVSLFPQVAAGAARHGAEKGPSILKNEAFTALRTRLGQQNPTGFSFEDLPKTAPDAYGAWLLISRLPGFADLFGVKSPPLLMPELPKLMAHLSPAGSVTWVDAQGFHSKGIEPFPGSTLVASDPAVSALYAEPMLISLLLPSLNRAREQANRVKSASNLRQIGLGAMMYANENQGQFPADLATMVKKEDLGPSVFIDPRSGTAPPPPGNVDAMAQWVEEHSDYVWLGKGKNANKVTPETVLAHEKLEGNTEGINVLFGDGHVEFMNIPEAQRAIERAKPGAKVDGNP
ncbi:MAG TPA: H-X9-DG-CTERM domain-containing protein [Tepidisphaeraceae bacterium]